MRRCALIVLIVFFTAAFAYAKDYEVKGKAGSYTVDVKFNKNPPAKGENRIEIDITDAAMKPITDATVVVKYLMPSLPGRPPMMEYSTTATPEGKKYKAILDLSMAGEWTFVINISHERQDRGYEVQPGGAVGRGTAVQLPSVLLLHGEAQYRRYR